MKGKSLFGFLFGWLLCFGIYECLYALSLTHDELADVGIKGVWDESDRFIKGELSIYIVWDGTNLYIENPSGRSEIHVSISNGFETVLPEGTTSAVVYVGAIEGPCVVVLTNQFGDRVEGILE